MLVKLGLYPVADLEIREGSTHRAHGGRLEDLDVGLHRERHSHLPSIVEGNDGEALSWIKLANLTLDQSRSPPPVTGGKHHSGSINKDNLERSLRVAYF